MTQQAIEVVVFDLNNTLYRKSSKDEFFKFVCFKKGYKILNIAQLAFLKIAGKLRLLDITTFKENFFRYLDRLEPATVSKYARQFWQIEYPDHFNKTILTDLKEHQKAGRKVLIITGGLEIYTKPLLEYLEVDEIIGTRSKYDDKHHVIVGEACKDDEKVRRLDEYMSSEEYVLMEAYSDEDEAIIHEAKKGYLVEDGVAKEL